MSQTAQERQDIVTALRAKYGDTVTRTQTKDFERSTGKNTRFVRATFPKLGRGLFALDRNAVAPVAVKEPKVKTAKVKTAKPVATPATPAILPVSNDATPFVRVEDAPQTSLAFAVSPSSTTEDIKSRILALAKDASALASIPAKNAAFVPFGDYNITRAIIASRQFHPVFITGLSGNGKTFQVEQACATESREYIRLNITTETDEDDLIGGFRLKNGETYFELGPVPIAMIRGAVLLIDEIDLGGAKLMCLQPVLEGKPLTIKKLGISIPPTPGFTIFATANTKGMGNDDGKFVGTNLLNEAFLERFPITIEQAYPSIQVEKKILSKTYEQLTGSKPDAETSTFFETLSRWAEAIRTTFAEGAIDDLISTRRLTHIVKTYAIFGNRNEAIALCLKRFDTSVQAKFLDFYSKLDPTNTESDAVPATEPSPMDDGNF